MNALHLLATKGEVELIQKLVHLGIPITDIDNFGETLLFHGLGLGTLYEALVSLFVSYNGDLNAQNNEGVK